MLADGYGWCEWLAEDGAGSQQLVTVWPEWYPFNPQARTRMLREAGYCARLQHPNIVPLLSYGEQSEWCWWIRPAQVGRMLSELMGAALDSDRVLGWMRQLTVALDYAHQSGIIHQRLHPDCIWVDEERLSVGEFAFAQLDEQIVQAGPYSLPSPRFMSPEQIMGAPLTPAANYFTLGSLAFELLSGRPLFEAAEVMQVIFKIIQEGTPSTEHLPAPLAEMIVRLTEKDVKTRLSQASVVLGYLGGEMPLNTASGPEMQGVLADLKAEGQTYSENQVFTLDPERAREKLGHFRFPEAGEWLVSLCAAAAALGAEKLTLDWQKQRLTLGFQGVRLSQAQLQDFWLSAYGAHQGGRGYLARGLASALTQQGGAVEVASGGWKLATDRVQKERLSRALVHQLQVRVEGCPEPAWEQLRRRFLFTALPICWQGKWQSTIVANRPAPLDGFSLRVDLLESPQWLAVVDGMSIAIEAVVPGSGQVVVWGPLRLDADRRRLLEDERLAELRPALKAAVETAIEEFALAPKALDYPAVTLYRRAVSLWEERQESGKLDQFTAAFLGLQDGGLPPERTAEECFRRAAAWKTPPDKFWPLAAHHLWFRLLEPDWATALLVSERAFSKEHARLHWLLQCWLEWNRVEPDGQQMGSLLYRFSDQRLDARFDPLLAERLPVDELTDVVKQSWIQLLPKHWTLSRARLKRTKVNPSPE